MNHRNLLGNLNRKFSKKNKVTILTETLLFICISLFYTSSTMGQAMAGDPPTITIQSPQNGSIVSGLVTLRVTVTAANGVGLWKSGLTVEGMRNIEPYLNGSLGDSCCYNSFNSLGSSSYVWENRLSAFDIIFDTSAWADGTYAIDIFSADSSPDSAAVSRKTISLTTVNRAPTLTIASPLTNSILKGEVTIKATANADPKGTAILNFVGLSIIGAQIDNPYLNGQQDEGDDSWGQVGHIDHYWSTTQKSYSFTFDASTIKPGEYKLVIFTRDSNQRTTSAAINIVIPITPKLNLLQKNANGGRMDLQVIVRGTPSIYSGQVSIESSDSQNGPWSTVKNFVGDLNALTTSVNLPVGTWVQASIQNVPQLNDSFSNPVQLLGKPIIKCTLPGSALINVPISGICTSDLTLFHTRLQLQTNIGSGWKNIANSEISGSRFPVKLSSRKTGPMLVRVTSEGQDGTFLPFASKTYTVNISTR